MVGFFLDLPGTRPWPSPSRSPTAERRPRRRTRPRGPRRATADRRLRILERLPGLAVEPIARGGAHGATQTTNHRADVGEPRDRSAGRLRPMRIARLSEAMIVARTMTRRAISARWVDCSNSTATMASRGRCFRFPRKPRRHGAQRAAARIAGAEFGAAGSRGGTFPGCKALKSHEMELESVDVTKAADQRSFVRARRPALGRAYRADRDRRARRRREASPKPLRSRLIVHLLNRGVSVAGIAAREGLGANRSRSEMAPQRLENIKSALGNGSVSEASKPQDVVHGRGAHRALRLTKGRGSGVGMRNFPPRNPLESLKTAKQSQMRRAWIGRSSPH